MTSKISSDDVTKAFFDIKICEQAWKTPESIRWGKKKNYSTLPGEQGGQAGSKGHLTHDQLHCRSHGRMLLHLYKKHVPKTVENFVEMITRKGEEGDGFRKNEFHRIIDNFMMQGGQIQSQSIYGPMFPDENFMYNHSRPGLLSMANRGPGTNTTQFFVTFNETPWLDGKHVVFGSVANKNGFKILNYIDKHCASKDGRPKKFVIIENCGVLSDTIEKEENKNDKSKQTP